MKMETDRVTLTDNTRGFEGDVIRRKPPYNNKDMVEHERKREIEVKLVMLEDKLVDQECYNEAEIAEKLQHARKTLTLEAAAASASASEQSGIVHTSWRSRQNNNTKGFEAAGVIRREPPYNKDKDTVEHDRKREIEVKLVMLEDKLVDQECYTEAEIAEKLQNARKTLTLEVAAA
ncbi:Serine/arginine repetitive matrix protein 2 [Melia azedarach]|uniref:Serine/arginine repetitive matrix protein 2 n=1 Tax=Melia azedarach TaxID=155640 RepID=A0ACC1XVN7_MELAZ|nr:Serine/arginine repetitive matrix protein 2 [Melia azedarach]